MSKRVLRIIKSVFKDGTVVNMNEEQSTLNTKQELIMSDKNTAEAKEVFIGIDIVPTQLQFQHDDVRQQSKQLYLRENTRVKQEERVKIMGSRQLSSFNSFDGKKECYQRADFDVSKNQVIKITQKQRINTEHKLLRFDLEKRVAKTLIERGYGYQKIKEISANTYSSLITSIVKTGLRTLTFLLINETNIPIIGFTQTEELKLRSPMAHGWEGLPQRVMNTFHKILRGAYGITQQTVQAQDLMRLYTQVRRQVDNRKKQEYEQTSFKTMDQQLYRKYKYQICKAYLQQGTTLLVQSYLKQKFKSHNWSIQFLNDAFTRLLRQAINAINSKRTYSIQTRQKICSKVVEKMIRFPNKYHQARTVLLSEYLHSNYI